MFLDDALGIRLRDVLVPDAFGIHDRDRPARADAQAIAFCAIHRPARSSEIQFLQPLLDVVPDGLTLIEIRAIGTETDEQMSIEMADAKRGRGRFGRDAIF